MAFVIDGLMPQFKNGLQRNRRERPEVVLESDDRRTSVIVSRTELVQASSGPKTTLRTNFQGISKHGGVHLGKFSRGIPQMYQGSVYMSDKVKAMLYVCFYSLSSLSYTDIAYLLTQLRVITRFRFIYH